LSLPVLMHITQE